MSGKRDFVAVLRHLDAPLPGRHFQADRCRADALVDLSFQVIESKLSALK